MPAVPETYLALNAAIVRRFELFVAGRSVHDAQEVWYPSVENGSEFVVAEAFGSSCRLERLEGIRVVFISIGLLVILIGFFIEWQAQKVRKRWSVDDVMTMSSLRGRVSGTQQIIPYMRKLYELPYKSLCNPGVACEEQAFVENQLLGNSGEMQTTDILDLVYLWSDL